MPIPMSVLGVTIGWAEKKNARRPGISWKCAHHPGRTIWSPLISVSDKWSLSQSCPGKSPQALSDFTGNHLARISLSRQLNRSKDILRDMGQRCWRLFTLIYSQSKCLPLQIYAPRYANLLALSKGGFQNLGSIVKSVLALVHLDKTESFGIRYQFSWSSKDLLLIYWYERGT